MGSPKSFGRGDVGLLGSFHATSKKMNNITPEREVDPVTGTEVHPQLRDPIADWFDIAEVSVFDLIDLCGDPASRAAIQCGEPLFEGDSVAIVVAPLQVELGWIRVGLG
jgi:hypothetical protein